MGCILQTPSKAILLTWKLPTSTILAVLPQGVRLHALRSFLARNVPAADSAVHAGLTDSVSSDGSRSDQGGHGAALHRAISRA